MKRVIVVLLISFFILGCKTSYQSKGYTGGFTEIKINQNTFKVDFHGNAYTSSSRVNDFALLRCAEVTKRNNCRFFVILNTDRYTTEKSYTTPGYSNTYIDGQVSHNSFNANAQTYSYGGQKRTVSKARSENTIVIFNSKPNSELYYDADMIIKEMCKKYDIELDS